jgi:hypothetical protein
MKDYIDSLTICKIPCDEWKKTYTNHSEKEHEEIKPRNQNNKNNSRYY